MQEYEAEMKILKICSLPMYALSHLELNVIIVIQAHKVICFQ